MAFKLKAGKEGPMKKNFPSVFKKDLPEVTVKDYEARVRILNPGYIKKGGKYYKEPMDPSFAITQDSEVSPQEALSFKRKSNVLDSDNVLGPATKIGEVKKRKTEGK